MSYFETNQEKWTHPLIRAASTPITGADVPPAPHPASEGVKRNETGASAGDIQMTLGPMPYGPFLPPEPRDCVIQDPARTPMTTEQIVRWNKLVSRGSNEPIVYSGVPLVRYADLIDGRSGGDMNNTTHRGNDFAVLGKMDADGRPIIPTDNTWKGQNPPTYPGYRIIASSPFYPLLDQDVQDVAWKYPHPDLTTKEGQPTYNFSFTSWEGFADGEMKRNKNGARDVIYDFMGHPFMILLLILATIIILWKMGKKNLLKN